MECVGFLTPLLPHLNLLSPLLPDLKPLLDQLRPYEIRVRELDKGVNKLRKEQNRVQHKVKDEEIRHGKAIEDYVIDWLKSVDEIISEYEKFNTDKDRPKAVCSNGSLPNLVIRCRLSRIVNDITKKVNKLLRDIKHDNFSYWRGPPSFDADFHNSIYEIFASRTQIVDAVTAALVDSNVGMIGVYGCSGVGKTALVKEVANKALKDNMFRVGIMVKVTRGLDTREIQGQIADRLGMKLEEESVSGRAARIRERLNNPKESILVILDDLRVKLDFNMLGIPYVNKEGKFDASGSGQTEEPLTSYKGCKILVISDSKQLLLSHMDGKGSPIFHVGALEGKEPEMLFKTLVEIGDENSVFETLAAEIAKKCNGLPVTIVTTAMALKNKSLTVWKDANKKLEMGILTTVPEPSTKLSYDLLENEELKHLFLICARLGHDALISDLVRYCIGLGLLQGIYTVREARDRVHALVGTLKELNLLSNSFSHDRFTMQDVIRDVALSIASQDMHALVLTKTKLDEWPDQDKLEKYTAISLHHCDMTDIIEEFPERINFSRLKVFRLDNSDTRLRIPGEFFKGMKELWVLILTGIHLSPLPSSIKCLKKLRMLGLEKCQLDETSLSVIGELKKLRVLSLSRSNIQYLPSEFGLLTKLQIFDISDCFNLKLIPVDVLSSLTSLEELYMGNSSIESVSLSELRQLNQLTSLDMQIPNMTYFPKNVFFDKLDSYKIIIGDFNAYPVWDFNMSETREASRFLALQLDNRFNIHSRKEIKILFERVENLLLGQLNDVEDIFNELNCEGFPYLKYLSILRNSKVKSIINSKNQKHDEKAFPKLVSLFLYEVNNMEHICHSRLTNDSFCKLKIIKLKICGQLNNVFFSSMIKHLKVLETIEVSECNSLKGIVTSETQSTDEVIDFPELRSLTLHSLSEFIGFYTLGSSSSEQELNRNLNELFKEKVIVSKLERIELSSIKIHKIWSDQPLKSASFQNLIQLDVNDCGNLNYLLSFSMAKRLRSLQSIFVSKCRMMVNIIKEEVGMTELQESIFPKLKIIKLSNMKRLGKIWHSKIPLHSFDKLDALIVEECNKLENVFPSYMMGRFQNLINLRVANCKSMKEIFDLKGSKQNIDGVTKLQNVHVEALPKLEHVWNKEPEGTLKFNNMQRIRIQECPNLKNIFPISIATSLENLEYLEVLDCGHIKEIVAMGETINHSSISFEFPKLTNTRFSKLPNLESFFGGTHELSCSALNDFSVELCRKLEIFRKQRADPEIKPVFLLEKVIYNLKSMQIETPDAKSLRSYIGNYRMYKLEEFQLSGLVDTEVLFFFLHRNPNLKSLLLSNCFFKELVPSKSIIEEKSGVVPKLKSLKLINIPSLKMIGFEEDPILFQRLECLLLKECPRLSTIVPPSVEVSFSYLTNLEVSNCNKLIYLMEPSTAKSLVQLTTMKVIQCESMETIVSNQENEELFTEKKEKKENEELFIFGQLKEIELIALHKLKSFCNSNHCAFEFPSLEIFVVSACSNMERFTVSENVKTPGLRQICIRHEKGEKRYYLKGNINATIQHMGKIWALDPDKMAASDPYQALQSFGLKTLKLVKSELATPHAIPTAVFPSLRNLEELEVSNTNVVVIFDIIEDEMKGYPFPLKKLTLDKLPNLEHVWDQKHEGILCFQNLHQVLVTNCENLKTLFPKKLAKKLEKLEKLEISHCERFLQIVEVEENATTEATEIVEEENATTEATEIVEEENATTVATEIVEEENATTEATEIVEEENATTEAPEEFLFPHLTSLHLRQLPMLTTNFYPGRFTLECPDLNHLEVLFCDKLEIFQRQQETQGSTSVNRQTVFSEGKVSFNLESLKFDWKNTMTLCNGKFLEDMLFKLVELELDFDDVNEVPGFPIELLEKASDLECVQIKRCRGLKELFPSRPKNGEIRMLGHLKMLSLVELHELESIGLQHEWLEQVCNKLQKLSVSSCPSLTTLVPSALSFSNLRQLFIKDCHGLKHLFTSSTAKMLVHLEEMNIVQCNSMEKILAEETDESTSEAIKFERLNTIVLDSLFSLVCFYSGSDTLQLSSLMKVLIWQCPDMEIFSQGVIHAEYFLGIQVSLDPNEDLLFRTDLNTTIEEMFQRQELYERIISNHRELQDGPQNNQFYGLKRLKLVNCNIHPYAIPSQILSYLNSLKELEVRDCNNVNVIFEMKGTEIAGRESFKLQRLTLQGLPWLTRVWENNQHGILSFQNLQHVSVKKCHNLRSLFPAALAKNLNKLKELKIESCDKLLDIIEKEEDAAANVTENFVFPCLKVLDLNDLPQFTYFYPQTFTLECPALNNLKVLACPKLELFQSAHPEGEGEGCVTSITRQPHISYLKVISNLEELSLDWKHISALSSSIRSGQFTEGFRYLNDISLYFDDADENEEPILPTEVLLKASNLKELRIEDWKVPKVFLAQQLKIGDDGMLGHLEVFTLDKVSELQSMNSEDSSWLNAIFEKLHKLNVFECPDLRTLMPSTSTVSFSCLRELHITKCPELQYLFTSSAAKMLMNIEAITVEECESMKKIVAKDGETTSEGIRFEQLCKIYLVTLSSLECFYSGDDTLQLSSLIQVKILQCPRMEIFCRGLIHAKSFRGIQTSSDPEDELVFHQDLNTSVTHVFLLQQRLLEGMDEMFFSNQSELQQVWLGEVFQQNNWFQGLKTMKLVNSEVQPYAIPAHILACLKSLKELEVRDCKKIKVIFDMKDSENVRRASSELQKLTLERLPLLTHVWETNHEGILGFQNLQHVFVKECGNLERAFPAVLAKNLTKLEKLEVLFCGGLQEIVGKVEDEATGAIEKFVFPRLTMLGLNALPQVTQFCPVPFTLECPALNVLWVWSCRNLKLFPDAHPEGECDSNSTLTDRQSFFSTVKAISKLKSLTLDWKHISVLRPLVEDLKYLNEVRLIFDVEKNENPTLPIEILEKAPNLQELSIECCNSLEIFLTPFSKIGEHRMLGKLKMLKLRRVSELQTVGSNDTPWLNTICGKLHKLGVLECPDLKTLIHSTSIVSFSYLKELHIMKCHRLQYLFTSSTVTKVMHLELVTVKECDSMGAIVTKEQGEITSDGIKFERLDMIVLSSLSTLKCFYSGNDTLELPSLRQVKILQCPKLDHFSLGLIDAKSFEGIHVSDNINEDLVFHDGLNSSVKRVFLLQANHLVVGDSYLLKEIWRGSEAVPDLSFRNLNSLVVDSCEFLSNVILPSHLLPFLCNLKWLEVLNCNSVKSIFGHSKMINMESQGSQSLPSLQVLQVENCKGLMEIVVKEEEEVTEEANKGLIIFPSMTTLRLFNLPKLRSIYSGMHILEWPKLKYSYISQCQMLNFFATEFPNSPDSRLEGQDSFPTDQQAFISLEKVTPCLEILSLGKKEAMMIEQGKLHVDLPLLDFLRLQGFDEESDEFPFAFCSKATLPSIKHLLVFVSSFKVIFPSQTLNIDYTKIFSQLKELHLVNLPLLESIGLEHSWVHPLLRNLDALFVFNCHCLKNLTPSTVSFSNLKKLSVGICHGLKYLFTSSTAKTLCVLESMHITNCDSMEAIVTKKGYEDEGESEGDGEGDKGEDEEEDEVDGEGEEDEGKGKGDKDELIFGKLEYLTLDSLPKLKSFYSGCSTLNFPYFMLKVSLARCNNMEVFSYGDVLPKNLDITIDRVSCKCDINSTIKQNYAVKRQREKSLSGERSLLVSTHGSLDSSNNAKMEC